MFTMCVYKAPANFIIPNLPTEFPFGFGMKNTGKIPKGSYRNTESVYNSSRNGLTDRPRDSQSRPAPLLLSFLRGVLLQLLWERFFYTRG